MDTGAAGTTRQRASINVTPLIDVLLVLLIIFMVIQPAIQHGLPALAPAPDAHGAASSQSPVMLLIRHLDAGATYTMDGQSVASGDLPAALRKLLATREDRAVLIDGDSSLEFSQVAAAVNSAQSAGADTIAFVTPGLKRAQP